ncbi:hypothetical protein QN277_001056 [Acacia crassicarpa]|uniref:SAM dependent carboxyl methyltransferase n=2 Tax=Acacia crassicarpa TaxID=499986 RepID=A0AAE1N916_9FABA|nr:hypothetical protein QN277_001056 [Acacia crassicarpa]
MTLTIFCVPPDSKNGFQVLLNIMGDVLVEMANKGFIGHELVDSFNIPIYTPASKEVIELIEKNGKFEIEKSELMYRLINTKRQADAQKTCMYVRALLEGAFKEHFEEGIVDELFIQYEKHLAEHFTTLFPVSDQTYKDFGGLFVMKRTLD